MCLFFTGYGIVDVFCLPVDAWTNLPRRLSCFVSGRHRPQTDEGHAVLVPVFEVWLLQVRLFGSKLRVVMGDMYRYRKKYEQAGTRFQFF